MELKEIPERVRKKHGIPITRRDVVRVFSAVLASSDIWRIVDLAGIPVLATCEVLQALAEKGLVEFKNARVVVTEEGRRRAMDLGISEAKELSCPRCRGRGLELSLFSKLAEEFHRLAKDRPEAAQEFDQGYVTEETTIARIALKELLVLGDDDLVSLAASLTRLPRRVAVLDVDLRIVRFLQELARREKLVLEVYQHDLREPLPPELRRQFDTFVCDPTESFRGYLAFAQRGIAALRGPGGAGYLGLTRLEASLEKWRKIELALLEAGAVITDLFPNFHEYVNWPYIETMRAWPFLPVKRVPGRFEPWYRSALIRIELVEETKVENVRYAGDIFTDEEAATT
ncbi:MAG: bis-aminopropyl spermidine synthase family protein [Candidatus Bipolaricaulota bacterium]|nr:bis-aminopropyl spermidine synthase family protein [Candidatus Bipolaricaulota bacterium]MDW8126240.1 bis-aminopropyl spermidine synthase family protein [Candidatus Bipolaricaulota bacterium]